MYFLLSHGHTKTYMDKRQNVSKGAFSCLVVSVSGKAVTAKTQYTYGLYLHGQGYNTGIRAA